MLAGLAVVAVVAVACTGIGAVAVAAGAMASATATGMVVGAVFGGVAAVGACAISDGNWELGINTETGVVYHARMLW